MENNKFDNNFTLNKLCIGTAKFAGNYGLESSSNSLKIDDINLILQKASKCGIEFIDTAQSYGNIENSLGSLNTGKFKIITKIKIELSISNIEKYIRDSVNLSLKKLNKKKIHGILIHNPETLYSQKGQNAYETLLKLRNEGLFEKIGVSIYDPDEYFNHKKNFSFEIVQLPFNLFDQRFIQSGIEIEQKKGKIEVFIRSIYLQGLLLQPLDRIPAKFNKWKKHFVRYEKWINNIGLSKLDACTNFVFNHAFNSKVVIGFDNLKQFEEIINIVSRRKIDTKNDLKIDDVRLINPKYWNEL